MKNHDKRVMGLSLDILDTVEERDPKLFQAAYPRIYKEPKHGSYYSPKLVASQIVQVALKIHQGMWGQNEKFEFLAFSQLAHYRVPTYYIGIGLMEALGKTKIPGAIEWQTMHVPFEAAVFLPPKGTLQHSEDGDVVFLGFARFEKNVTRPSKIANGMIYASQTGGMTLFAGSAAGYLYHWNISPDAHGPTIQLADMEGNPGPTHRSEWPLRTLEMTDADNRMMVRVAHYVFAVLMVMTARPVLVTSGEMERRVSNKRGREREFWTPPVIGENYGVRYVRSEIVRAGPTGTHASPRLHWVPGYTREQRYGPKGSLKKPIWVEPYMRGGNEEQEVA